MFQFTCTRGCDYFIKNRSARALISNILLLLLNHSWFVRCSGDERRPTRAYFKYLRLWIILCFTQFQTLGACASHHHHHITKQQHKMTNTLGTVLVVFLRLLCDEGSDDDDAPYTQNVYIIYSSHNMRWCILNAYAARRPTTTVRCWVSSSCL